MSSGKTGLQTGWPGQEPGLPGDTPGWPVPEPARRATHRAGRCQGRHAGPDAGPDHISTFPDFTTTSYKNSGTYTNMKLDESEDHEVMCMVFKWHEVLSPNPNPNPKPNPKNSNPSMWSTRQGDLRNREERRHITRRHCSFCSREQGKTPRES